MDRNRVWKVHSIPQINYHWNKRVIFLLSSFATFSLSTHNIFVDVHEESWFGSLRFVRENWSLVKHLHLDLIVMVQPFAWVKLPEVKDIPVLNSQTLDTFFRWWIYLLALQKNFQLLNFEQGADIEVKELDREFRVEQNPLALPICFS